MTTTPDADAAEAPARACGAEPGCEAPARRGMSEAERRGQLLRVALGVFIREGYAASNMNDIARAAGMSKKTLYQIFPSKAALFEALVVDRLADLQYSFDDAGLSLEEALVQYLTHAAQVLLSSQQVGLCRLVSAEGSRHPELAEAFHRAGPGRGTTSIERWLATQAEAGRLRIENAQDTAHLLFGMAIGGIHIKLMLGMAQTPTPAAIDARVRQAVRIFLHGAATGQQRARQD
jgi:AcrR family transcriptional regulator